MKIFEHELFSKHSESHYQHVVTEQSRFLVEFVLELEVGHLPFGNLKVLGAIDGITEVPLILLIDVLTI